MKRAVTTMQALISDLLDLEQSNADVLRIEPAPVSSGDLVRDALDAYATLADAAGVVLRAAGVVEVDVNVDRRRVHQVLANLIGNALKVSARGAAITIAVVQETDALRISVSDQGPGIAPEDQRRVFEPFFTKDVGGVVGTGLGLTISKRIIDASGGRIGVESVPPDGATFWFTLPRLVRPPTDR